MNATGPGWRGIRQVAGGILLSVLLLAIPQRLVAQELGELDDNVFGIQSWPPTFFGGTPTYADTNFWVHNYHVDPGLTHSGADYHVPSGAVRSPGYGRFGTIGGSCNTVPVHHLLDSGESVIFNFLHMASLDADVVADDYVAQYQYFGPEGNSCLGGGNAHMHVEASDTETSTWLCDAAAFPGDGGTSDPQFRKDALEPHYDEGCVYQSTNRPNGVRSQIFYRPSEVTARSDLLPYVSPNPNPSPQNYAVYGEADSPLYGTVTLFRENQLQFDEIAVQVDQATDVVTCDASDDCPSRYGAAGLAANSGGELVSETQQDVSGTTTFSGNYSYSEGTYVVAARIGKEAGQGTELGFPLLFAVLPADDIIVDNDQINAGNYQYVELNSAGLRYQMPGYFASGQLVQGGNAQESQWKPGVASTYRIYAYVNKGASATSVTYTLSLDGTTQNLLETEAINHSQNHSSWVQLTTADASEFAFTDVGYVELAVSDIADTEWIAFDALKFEYVATGGGGGGGGGSTNDCQTFADVPLDAWFHPFVEKLNTHSIIQGYPDGLYGPANTTNRAEFLKMVLEAARPEENFAAPADDPFVDVSKTEWFAPYVAYAKTEGIVEGYADGTFRPAEPVLRSEAVKLLVESFGAAELPDVSVITPKQTAADRFSDVSLDDWFHTYVDTCQQNGIVDGYPDGTFGPGREINRAEAAKIICLATFGSGCASNVCGAP